MQPTLQQAVLNYKSGQLKQAEDICRLLIQTNPDNADALNLLGIIIYRTGDSENAITLLKKALTLNPHNYDIINNLANLYKTLGKYKEAALFFSDSLEINSKQMAVWSNFVNLVVGHEENIEENKVIAQLLTPPNFFSRLQIEITTFCNLKCAECPRTVGIKQGTWSNKNMPFDMFVKIIQEMPASTILILQGVGEPTLHPELIEMVSYAKSLNKFNEISFNTNAVTRSVKYYRELKKSGINYISISVDSFDNNIAELCRSGTSVLKLKKRISELYGIFDNIAISIVVSKINLNNIKDTLNQLNSIGKFVVEIQPVINYKSKNEEDASLTPMEVNHLRNNIENNNEKWSNLNIILADNLKKSNLKCTRPFVAPYITVDGYLTPCCTTYDESLYGSILATQPFKKVWESKAVKEWLSSYLSNEPAICNGCCFNPKS